MLWWAISSISLARCCSYENISWLIRFVQGYGLWYSVESQSSYINSTQQHAMGKMWSLIEAYVIVFIKDACSLRER